jgi:hypothetical protein
MRRDLLHLGFMVMFVGLQGLFSFGCDKGFSYRPEGWDEQGNGLIWEKQWPDLKVKTRGLSGLSGSERLSVEFEITNRAKETMVLESVRLITKKNSYPISLASLSDAPSWRTIPPGETRRMPLGWPLEASEPMSERLGRTPKIAQRNRNTLCS